MLSEDSLLLRIEDVLFVDVESKMTFFVTFHADHELVNESNVQIYSKIWCNINVENTFN